MKLTHPQKERTNEWKAEVLFQRKKVGTNARKLFAKSSCLSSKIHKSSTAHNAMWMKAKHIVTVCRQIRCLMQLYREKVTHVFPHRQSTHCFQATTTTAGRPLDRNIIHNPTSIRQWQHSQTCHQQANEDNQTYYWYETEQQCIAENTERLKKTFMWHRLLCKFQSKRHVDSCNESGQTKNIWSIHQMCYTSQQDITALSSITTIIHEIAQSEPHAN